MQEVLLTVSVIHSARTVGGVAVAVVIAVLQHRDGRCIRYRSAKASATLTEGRQTKGRTLAACNAARYSES